ncbi:hypothetical protein KKD19_05165, partial [Patescibacteria group bacterium]|nr:hypothetical protein [Patescibacteria group bacterium]MCG2692980.1 hypothetical protein [Candidatus Parcubacteria bacterium]
MKIAITLNKKLDYEVYLDFHNFSVAGANFGKKIKHDHPGINLKNYISYIDSFYDTYHKLLLKKQQQINISLKKKVKVFSAELKKIFGPLAKNQNYKGYLSM